MNLTLAQENVMLRNQVEDLKAKVAALTSTPSEKMLLLKEHFSLTPAQAHLLLLLLDGSAHNTLWLAARICRETSDPDTIKVVMSALRKRIAPHRIRTVHTMGYCLEGESLEAIRKIAKGEA